jgi:hypothetical protein
VQEMPIKALSHLQPLRIYTYLQHKNKSILLIGHPPVIPTASLVPERASASPARFSPRPATHDPAEAAIVSSYKLNRQRNNRINGCNCRGIAVMFV